MKLTQWLKKKYYLWRIRRRRIAHKRLRKLSVDRYAREAHRGDYRRF